MPDEDFKEIVITPEQGSFIRVEGVNKLRVYSKYGTLASVDNAQIVIDPDGQTLNIYVWKSDDGRGNTATTLGKGI